MGILCMYVHVCVCVHGKLNGKPKGPGTGPLHKTHSVGKQETVWKYCTPFWNRLNNAKTIRSLMPIKA